MHVVTLNVQSHAQSTATASPSSRLQAKRHFALDDMSSLSWYSRGLLVLK